MQNVKSTIRLLESRDIPQIAKAFKELGWNKPVSQYEQYLLEQESTLRGVYIDFVEQKFAGYLTICWTSDYPPFQQEKIPEIVDFNVLPKYRRQRIGMALMDMAENEIAKVRPIAGIGVGVTPDYGAAQRLYALRGYFPDGRGLYYQGDYPTFGEQITMGDDPTMYFTKRLK